MHGVSRSKYKSLQADLETATALEKKALQWNTLTKAVLESRQRLMMCAASNNSVRNKQEPPRVVSNEEEEEEEEIKKVFELTSKLLVVNPDPSHLWNYRRELLMKMKDLNINNNNENNKGDDNEKDNDILKTELEITQKALEKNPKAYSAWFHRKWILRQEFLFFSKETDETVKEKATFLTKILAIELKLCQEFLTLDERNFHCWNYRRFIVALSYEVMNSNNVNANKSPGNGIHGAWDWISSFLLNENGNENETNERMMGPQLTMTTTKTTKTPSQNNNETKIISPQAKQLIMTEWDFSTTLIQKNFSNYSAFHYRSKLIPLYLEIQQQHEKGDKEKKRLELATSELEIIQQAIFTEPDDQTAWWYHHFIIGSFLQPLFISTTITTSNSNTNDNNKEVLLNLLHQEIESIRELIEMEDGVNKWGLLTVHDLLGKLRLLKSTSLQAQEEKESEEEDKIIKEEQIAILESLIEIDPDRKMRYEHMMRVME